MTGIFFFNHSKIRYSCFKRPYQCSLSLCGKRFIQVTRAYSIRAYTILFVLGCILKINHYRDQHLQFMRERILEKSRTFVNIQVVIKALGTVAHLLGIGNLDG